jgi:hypothetical protein
VAFVALDEGGYDVMAIGVGSGTPTRIRDGAGEELDPTWSPGGDRLAFAVQAASNPNSDIWTADPDGTSPVRLTRDRGTFVDRHPAWSPDGSTIAWTRSVPPTGTSAIWLMDAADGRPATPLTDPTTGDADATPAWSPRGDRIAFVSDRGTAFPELYVMRANGSGRRRLTRTSVAETNPAWSPDGTTLVFERARPDEPSDLWTLDVATGEQRRLTSGPGWESDPAWSPDGGRVTFVSAPRAGGDRDLRVLDVETGVAVDLAAGPLAELTPAWRPSSGVLAPDPEAAVATPDEERSAPSEPVGLSPRYTSRRRRVADGVWFRRLVDRAAPNRIFVIRVDAGGPATVDVGLGSGVLPGFERTTSIARRYDAVAATNGDFPIVGNGRPVHAYAEDGELGQTTFARSAGFSFTSGEPGGMFRRPEERIVLREASGEAWRVSRWNAGDPAAAEAAGVSPLAAEAETPPRGACSARLVPTGRPRWTEGRTAVAQKHVVDAATCRADHLTRGGGSVISARPGTVESLLVASLSEGETVALEWAFGPTATRDTMGGFPLLLRKGRIVPTQCAARLCRRHPRTGVGVTANGSVLMVVVDGRRPFSRGLTLVGFARLLRGLGARWALNLDGGGSSTMVVRGRVVNVPSDGRERPVCCAMLALRGPDPGQALGEGAPAVRAAPSERLRRLVSRDPASSGGLADALARGALDGHLTPGFRPALRLFRQARPR